MQGGFIHHKGLYATVDKYPKEIPLGATLHSFYLYLKVIRPLSRLYGVSSTFTVSPGRILI